MVELAIFVVVIIVAARILFVAIGFLVRLAVVAFLVMFVLGIAHRHGLDGPWDDDERPSYHSSRPEPPHRGR